MSSTPLTDLEKGLLRDSDWALLDGVVCRVTSLRPMGFAKGIPLAAIELESPLLTEPTTGFVTHRLDYEHLREAFRHRESEPNAEVLLIWTKQHLKRTAKLVARFMPRMWVMLCAVNSYELMTDRTYEPELDGFERWEAQRPTAEWKPDVMQAGMTEQSERGGISRAMAEVYAGLDRLRLKTRQLAEAQAHVQDLEAYLAAVRAQKKDLAAQLQAEDDKNGS